MVLILPSDRHTMIFDFSVAWVLPPGEVHPRVFPVSRSSFFSYFLIFLIFSYLLFIILLLVSSLLQAPPLVV